MAYVFAAALVAVTVVISIVVVVSVARSAVVGALVFAAAALVAMLAMLAIRGILRGACTAAARRSGQPFAHTSVAIHSFHRATFQVTQRVSPCRWRRPLIMWQVVAHHVHDGPALRGIGCPTGIRAATVGDGDVCESGGCGVRSDRRSEGGTGLGGVTLGDERASVAQGHVGLRRRGNDAGISRLGGREALDWCEDGCRGGQLTSDRGDRH